jgi:hypothetical protein
MPRGDAVQATVHRSVKPRRGIYLPCSGPLSGFLTSEAMNCLNFVLKSVTDLINSVTDLVLVGAFAIKSVAELTFSVMDLGFFVADLIKSVADKGTSITN